MMFSFARLGDVSVAGWPISRFGHGGEPVAFAVQRSLLGGWRDEAQSDHAEPAMGSDDRTNPAGVNS
jgi:hypothetical protein